MTTGIPRRRSCRSSRPVVMATNSTPPITAVTPPSSVPTTSATVIAITVALVVGTLEGGVTAVIGGVLFVAMTTGLDERQDLLRGMPVVIVWAAAALIAGSTAERYRRRTQRALADVM